MSSIGASKLLIMTSWLFDACLFGASGLAARMARLIIVHDRLVNKVCTIDELTLTSTAVLLVQKRDTVVHLNCSLWRRRHSTILLLQHHSLHWLCLFYIHSVHLAFTRGRRFWIHIVRVFWALLLAQIQILIYCVWTCRLKVLLVQQEFTVLVNFIRKGRHLTSFS